MLKTKIISVSCGQFSRLCILQIKIPRVSKYKQWEHEFDEVLSGIEFPVNLSDVSKFAKRTNLLINVYFYDNKCIAPLEVTDEEKEKHVD